MREQYSTTVRVTGVGPTKAGAFSSAISQVQRQVLQKANLILLRIEPVDVAVIRAQESKKTERFLFFFLPREKRTFHVELDITVNITAIDPEKVNFSVE